MRIPLLLVSLTTLLPAMAHAQQSDTQQILQLLQGMNGRLDSIEKRLDTVETGQKAAAPSAEPAPGSYAGTTEAHAVSAPATAPSGVAVPGWKVDVLPYGKDGELGAAITRVVAPAGLTTFDLHFAQGPVANPVAYRGKAYFWAKTSGTYTFNVYFDQSDKGGYIYSCEGSLKIGDTEVVKNFSSKAPAAMGGSVDLEAGKYDISYTVGCWYKPNDQINFNMDETIRNYYKSIHYKIGVIGPDDASLRDFDRDELFIIVPSDRVKKQ